MVVVVVTSLQRATLEMRVIVRHRDGTADFVPVAAAEGRQSWKLKEPLDREH